MAVTCNKWAPQKVTLGTTLTRVQAGDEVRTVWLISASDLLVTYDSSKNDGDAISATLQDFVPAGMSYPIQIGRGAPRPAVCTVSGSASAWLRGEP